jgi:hypothetical protein
MGKVLTVGHLGEHRDASPADDRRVGERLMLLLTRSRGMT